MYTYIPTWQTHHREPYLLSGAVNQSIDDWHSTVCTIGCLPHLFGNVWYFNSISETLVFTQLINPSDLCVQWSEWAQHARLIHSWGLVAQTTGTYYPLPVYMFALQNRLQHSFISSITFACGFSSELFMCEKEKVALLLSLLDEEDFYVRYHAMQLMTGENVCTRTRCFTMTQEWW